MILPCPHCEHGKVEALTGLPAYQDWRSPWGEPEAVEIDCEECGGRGELEFEIEAGRLYVNGKERGGEPDEIASTLYYLGAPLGVRLELTKLAEEA